MRITNEMVFMSLKAILAGIIILLIPPMVEAQERCKSWSARVVSVQGTVMAKKADGKEWAPTKLHDTFCPGDMIMLQSNSRAALILPNEATIRLDENTTLTFVTAEETAVSFIDILRGAVHFFSRIKRSLKVDTPFVNAAVEGTEFFVRVEKTQTFISIFEGQVAASNDSGSIILAKGESAIARPGRAPLKRVVAHPREAVQWTLYYPPIIDFRASEFSGQEPWQKTMRKSLGYYWQGKPANALDTLRTAPAGIDDPRFYVYRAALLLTVGRVKEAETDVRDALANNPKDSRAIALKSVIALANNDNEEAYKLASQAVEASNKKSSTAWVALAYAQQANFDLRGALSSIQTAVKLDSKNALAQATLAEIWLALGYLDRALLAAQEASKLNPDLARTQTVLGFAFLTQIDINDSKNAFLRAITLDQADPLPRLGLGLALIRGGDLNGGRQQIEMAASLDPISSLIRSYLGKAFYEEKRDRLASNQFTAAKELDPKDPTPWFYDAILKQTTNRPVEALK